jgi:excisionase family DNA binding protein
MLHTVTEVATILKVHPVTIRRLLRKGRVPHFRSGRVIRVNVDEVIKAFTTKKGGQMAKAEATYERES